MTQRNNTFISYFKNKLENLQVKDFVRRSEVTHKYDALVFGNDEEKLEYKLSKCCNPIAGDAVFGFITINDGSKFIRKIVQIRFRCSQIMPIGLSKQNGSILPNKILKLFCRSMELIMMES